MVNKTFQHLKMMDFVFFLKKSTINWNDTCISALTALSNDEPGEEDMLDAGCLLDILRLYRWHISSSEEQVSHLCICVIISMFLSRIM